VLFDRAIVATRQTAAGDLEALMNLLLVRCDIERRRLVAQSTINEANCQSVRELFGSLKTHLLSLRTLFTMIVYINVIRYSP
jgi:hypothetical protein